MSIDYYACKNCGTTFADCGDYTGCTCGEMWCSDICAEEDGYIRGHCKLDKDVEDGCPEEECEFAVRGRCNRYGEECEYWVKESCKYCREEDFEDRDLLEYVLDQHLNMSRQELIDIYKLHRGGNC